jgi:aspartate aminotransferase-like enzyme
MVCNGVLSEIDVLLAGAQKVLGALTGVTPLALSEAAWLVHIINFMEVKTFAYQIKTTK